MKQDPPPHRSPASSSISVRNTVHSCPKNRPAAAVFLVGVVGWCFSSDGEPADLCLLFFAVGLLMTRVADNVVTTVL